MHDFFSDVFRLVWIGQQAGLALEHNSGPHDVVEPTAGTLQEPASIQVLPHDSYKLGIAYMAADAIKQASST